MEETDFGDLRSPGLSATNTIRRMIFGVQYLDVHLWNGKWTMITILCPSNTCI